MLKIKMYFYFIFYKDASLTINDKKIITLL